MTLRTGQDIQLKRDDRVVTGRLDKMMVNGLCVASFGELTLRMSLAHVWEHQLRIAK